MTDKYEHGLSIIEALSHRMKILYAYGLVKCRKDGKLIFIIHRCLSIYFIRRSVCQKQRKK